MGKRVHQVTRRKTDMFDRHHIIHERVPWNSRKEGRVLRSTPLLVPRISRELHEEIHRNCPPIPLLGYHALTRVLSEFKQERDTLRTIDNLQLAIEHSSRHYKTHPVERELSYLAIEAIGLQIPYLKEEL